MGRELSRVCYAIKASACRAAFALALLLVACVVPANAQLPDPNQGPGGPILVVTSASSMYGNYYAEILRTEGFNEFAVRDLGAVTESMLSAYDVVILAPSPLTAGQVSLLSDWVNAGGNLIAMRPDPQLAGLLGLTSMSVGLSGGYLRVDTSRRPGNGIVGQPMQFHGTADAYALSGATSLATLYTDPTTVTPYPAVTLRSVGTGGGYAAAFAYDLATSIVYTRQGNPAWAAEERDGYSPIRPDDKFYGGLEPDWVDLDNEVAIPQADEQQRLLANLILYVNLAKKPLPRFWYFPNGKKAAVIMTGDDHGNGGTSGRFDQYIAASPSGCNVDNWECIRSTSYIYVGSSLTNAEAAAYAAQGFEVGLHINTNCADFTPTSLNSTYSQQVAAFESAYPSIPAPATQRHHCIVWSDWVTAAKTQIKYGMRLDTDYYFWPPEWIQDRPGHFTGSAMPMRFADLDGTLIDVYNVSTQMTDESGQSYPFTSDTLLSAAVGAQGFYGAYTVNAHTDTSDNPVSDAVLSSARKYGVPVVSSAQMLRWLDARNASSFSGLAWSDNTLSFTITPGSGANGLQAMVPTRSSNGLLTGITGPGGPVMFRTETIKGIEYASFSVAGGAYAAAYAAAADVTPPTVFSISPPDGASGVSQGTAVTATFSEAIEPGTINSSSFVLHGPADAVVPANIAYNADTRTATLTPGSSLAFDTAYSVTLTTDIKDLSGNAMAAPYNWSFTTGSGPSCPCSAWASSQTPANPSANDPNPIELGVKFAVDLNGFITGVRFYKGTANTGTHIGSLWTSSGQLLAAATFTNETASGWQQVDFSVPVPVTANTVYVASYHTNTGYYAGDNNYFATSGVDSPPVHLLQNSVSGGNGVYTYGSSSSFPASSYQATNYWVDLVFTTSVVDVTPPTVASTSPANGALGVSQSTTVTATFSEAIDPGTITPTSFVLRDPANAVIPAIVAYSAGTHTATLTPGSALTAAATYSATLTTDIKDLTGNALVGAYVWSFTTAAPLDVTPPTVTSTFPEGGALEVSQSTAVAATFSEAIAPATVTASSFVLRDAASALVPAAVTYDAGTHTATLTPASPLAGAATYSATLTTAITDVAGNALAAAYAWSFTTAAPLPPVEYSAWSSSAVPANPSENDPAAVELGVKFRVDVNGLLTAVRFYKGPKNTGTHVGNLWSSTGQLLATATFTNETASGWQQVTFPSPVPVTANTVYVASYHTNTGYYANDNNYFATSGVDNPPVHLLRNGVSGGNGVYAYGAGSSFPGNTYLSTNYWVDIVFTTGGGSTPLAVTATTPVNNATGVSAGTAVSATFNNALNASTVTASSFTLRDSSNATISGTYAVSGSTATLVPGSALAAGTYTATLTTGITDVNGNALTGNFAWSFTVDAVSGGPEPAGWYAGDMHVHRSCGGSPEEVSSLYSKMSTNNLAVISLLADMGNGEVQNPVTDLPLVNGQDASVSTPDRVVHWDAEWHWDANYTQYEHQALGGHVVALGVSEAHQIWEEYTYPIFTWAHQRNGIAGFVHMQYLDGGIPNSLSCCTPIEYPVEVALGSTDFIAEDVDDNNSGIGMNPDAVIDAYYKLLNSGFRPGLAAGSDYPCNSSRPLGSLLTYVQPIGGQMTYQDWVQGIAQGRTVVSRNAHKEFLALTVNGTATPGDEVRLAAAGTVPVAVQWTATENFSGTLELVSNGVVVATQQASVAAGTPATWSTTVSFPKSGWIAARRMGADGHLVHTAAVFVIVNNAPIRASASDAQFYVQWMDNLLERTSPGGAWNSYFPTSLNEAQARYQAARAVFQQIAAEASGVVPSSLALSPASVTGGANSAGTVTLSTAAPAGGATVTLTSSNTAVASVPASVTVAAGGTTATFTLSTTAVAATTPVTITATYGGGSATATLTVNPATTLTLALNPASVTGGANSAGTVTLSTAAPAGGATVALTSSNPAVASVPASVTVAAGGTTATFTLSTTAVAATTPVTITATYGGGSATATLTVNPATTLTLALNPASVTGGAGSAGTVTLSAAAPAGGATVTLTSSNPAAATVPASVTVAAGGTTGTFTVSTTAVAATTPVTITATYGGGSADAELTLNPPAATLSQVSLNPTAVTGGAASTGTVTLSGAAPAGGVTVQVSTGNPAVAAVPASVTVAAGATSATFTITTSPVSAGISVVISAMLDGTTRTATLTVHAAALSSLSLNPTTVKSGQPSAGTVTLTGPAASAITVSLSSDNTSQATVPANVTVPAGNVSASFTVSTSAVSRNTWVTISATYLTVTRSANLRLRH